MTLIKWQHRNPLSDMVSNIFDNDLGDFFGKRFSDPAANIIENNDSFNLEIAAPGMVKDDGTVAAAIKRSGGLPQPKSLYYSRHFPQFGGLLGGLYPFLHRTLSVGRARAACGGTGGDAGILHGLPPRLRQQQAEG